MCVGSVERRVVSRHCGSFCVVLGCKNQHRGSPTKILARINHFSEMASESQGGGGGGV